MEAGQRREIVRKYNHAESIQTPWWAVWIGSKINDESAGMSACAGKERKEMLHLLVDRLLAVDP